MNGERIGSLHVIVGGARSGKSEYAERCARELSERVLYVATAVVTDEDMARRIAHHRQSRPASWATEERYSNFEALATKQTFEDSEVVLVDCLTVMLTNLMLSKDVDYDTAAPDMLEAIEMALAREVDVLMDTVLASGKQLILVTNEVGMGLVPAYRLGNIFRDIAGRMNRRVAARADTVTFVAVGIPLRLKGTPDWNGLALCTEEGGK